MQGITRQRDYQLVRVVLHVLVVLSVGLNGWPT
jgi:hypothetical protein